MSSTCAVLVGARGAEFQEGARGTAPNVLETPKRSGVQMEIHIGDKQGTQDPLMGDCPKLDEYINHMPSWWFTQWAPRGHRLGPVTLREAQDVNTSTYLAISETPEVCFPATFGCVLFLLMWICMGNAWVMGLLVRFARVVSMTPYGWSGSRGAEKNPAKEATKCKCSILRLPRCCDGPEFNRTRSYNNGGELSPPLSEKSYGVAAQPVCDSVLIPRHGGVLNMVAEGGFGPLLTGEAQDRSENAFYDVFNVVSTAISEVLGSVPLGLGFGEFPSFIGTHFPVASKVQTLLLRIWRHICPGTPSDGPEIDLYEKNATQTGFGEFPHFVEPKTPLDSEVLPCLVHTQRPVKQVCPVVHSNSRVGASLEKQTCVAHVASMFEGSQMAGYPPYFGDSQEVPFQQCDTDEIGYASNLQNGVMQHACSAFHDFSRIDCAFASFASTKAITPRVYPRCPYVNP